MYKIIMIEIQTTKTRRHRQTDRQTQCFNDKQGQKMHYMQITMRKIQNTNKHINKQTNALIH